MNGFIVIPLMMVLHYTATMIVCMWHRTILFNEIMYAREQIDQQRILLEYVHAAACEKVALTPSFFTQQPAHAQAIIEYKDERKQLTIVSYVRKSNQPIPGNEGLKAKTDEVLFMHTIASDNKKHMSSIRCYLTLGKTFTRKEKNGLAVVGYTFCNLM